MSKNNKVWQTITIGLLVVIVALAMFIVVSEVKAVRTQQEAQESRITTLEQDILTIKQGLDAKGYTDLNL